MNENFSEILGRIMRATGTRTQVELAKVLDIRQSSISDAKRRQSVPAEWLLKLFRTHGLNPDWLYEGQGPMYLRPETQPPETTPSEDVGQAYQRSMSRSRTVNVSSMFGRQDQTGRWQPEFVEQLAVAETYAVPQLLVVRVDGGSMEPCIRRNSFIGLNTEQKTIVPGEVYGLTPPGEGLLLRRVRHNGSNQTYRLCCDNAQHPERQVTTHFLESIVVGRCAWVIQQL